jgi:hypothetical protein
MSTMPAAEDAEEVDRRQWPRYALGGREPFTLTADGRICECRIEDISLGGARLSLEGETPRNLEIRIEHPLVGHAYARRCWKGSRSIGVEFDFSQQSLDFISHCLQSGSGSAPVERAG